MYQESKKGVSYVTYEGKSTGYLDWYYSDPRSILPIRDVTKRKGRNKKEPHYEKRTFNEEVRCNTRLLNGAIKKRVGFIFFYTKYEGQKKEFRGKYFITGYYKLSKITKNKIRDPKGDRYAVKANDARFFAIEDSYPLEKIAKKIIRNPRWIKPKHLSESHTKSILSHFQNKTNRRRDFVKLTKRLYNSD